ncbi:MAG: T9SS type A sorting domain-containing protein [Arcicella sp.]|nr:T9SS type A sorting domain-containing protein [Arcicella sp.]
MILFFLQIIRILNPVMHGISMEKKFRMNHLSYAVTLAVDLILLKVSINACSKRLPKIAEISCTVSTDDFDQGTTFIVYPNHTDNIITIDGKTDCINKFDVILYNILGVQLDKKQINVINEKFQAQFDMSDKNKGIYMVRIISENYGMKVVMVEKVD